MTETTNSPTKPNEPACTECSRLASRVEELEKMIAKHSSPLGIIDSASDSISNKTAREIRPPINPSQELSFIGDPMDIAYICFGGKYYTANHKECIENLLEAYMKNYNETDCGQPDRDAAILAALNPEIIFYGPHPCRRCGNTIARASEEQGGIEFNYPDGPIYPNTNWVQHACPFFGQPAPEPTKVNVQAGAVPEATGNSDSEKAK